MENLQREPALAWTFRHRSRLPAAIVPEEVELLLVRSINVKQVGRRVLVERDQEELTVVVPSLNPAELDVTARRVRRRVADHKHRDLMLPGGFGGFDRTVAAGWTVRAGIVVEDVLVGEVIRVVKTCVEDAYRQAAVVERLDSLRVDPDTLGAAVHAESAQRAGFQRSIAGSSAEVSLDGKSPSSLDGVRFRVDDLDPRARKAALAPPSPPLKPP
jgi:hypothetical protein